MKNIINRALAAKKKMIFSLMLAIVSSVWMMKAACLMQAPEAMYQPFETVSGTLTSIGFPCEGEEPCPTCLTIALVTDAKTYYLSTSDAQMQAQLDELEMQLPLRATISGTPFVNGSFDFIKVQSVSVDNSLLPSLCDEWNVLHEPFSCDGIYCRLQTFVYRLTTDTLIQDVNYVKLMEQEGSNTYYKGAMREGTNRDIYYVPAGSTNEYLLYAFNAQEGDQLNNVWLGGNPEDYPYGWTMTVEAIQETNPRTFVLSTGFITTEEGVENYPLYTTWIEGVGFPETPHEVAELLSPADVGVYTLLCAYKNGEQIYVSEMGAEYGCEHDLTPEPTDTIPLFSYTGDDPGSSTVDPVDPNQVVATLQGDQLTIHEHSGVDVTYTLRHNAPAQMPSLHRAPQSDTFRDMVTLQITESGEYMLLLTNPSWGYSIFGRFNYMPQGIISVHSSSAPQKVLQNGQMSILRGEKMYTVTGQEVR